MESINGFVVMTEWRVTANGSCAKAIKDGKTYFIKKLNNPTYPPSYVDKETFERNKKFCDEWFDSRRRIVNKLQTCAGTCRHMIVPSQFFLDKCMYYVVSDFVQNPVLTNEQISERPESQKYALMRRYLEALVQLQNIDIVHSDLKPDNVLVVEMDGEMVPMIIDFEGCYPSGDPPAPDSTQGSPEYYSPELGRYIAREDERIKAQVTCKSDVFAAGLMFYEYWTGRFPEHTYKYSYQSKKNEDLKLMGLPSKLEKLLRLMLEVDYGKRIDAKQALESLDSIISGGDVTATTGKEGIQIIEIGPDLYAVIKGDGSRSTVNGAVAEYLSKAYKTSIKKSSSAPEPTHDTEPDGIEIVDDAGQNVVFIGRDGKRRSLPKQLFELFRKEGKL